MGRIQKQHKGHNVTIKTFPGRAETEGKWIYEVDIGWDEGGSYTEKAFHGPKAYDTEEKAIQQAAAVAVTYIEKGKV